jgi:hypothetical protein
MRIYAHPFDVHVPEKLKAPAPVLGFVFVCPEKLIREIRAVSPYVNPEKLKSGEEPFGIADEMIVALFPAPIVEGPVFGVPAPMIEIPAPLIEIPEVHVQFPAGILMMSPFTAT